MKCYESLALASSQIARSDQHARRPWDPRLAADVVPAKKLGVLWLGRESLVRLSQEEMMSVNDNKDRTWVGSSASLWPV